MPELRLPTVDVHQSFLAAMAEFEAEGRGAPDDESIVGQEIREYRDRWSDPSVFAGYVDRLIADAREETPRRAGWVPCTTLWYIDRDQYLGRLAIRHRLNDRLREEGGHIGYDVRPSARRRGCATRMLRVVLRTVYGLGIDRALVMCDTTNIGSRRTIENNGGILEDERNGKLRFWVSTSPRERDWLSWHHAYDDPESALTRRLATVQEQVRLALDAAPPGTVKILSLCAGQGLDLTGSVPGHPRASDVQVRLVELDPRNAAIAGASGFEVVVGDAGLTELYADFVPAEIVLLCGMFGNITETDLQRTIAASGALCTPGGRLIWTRGRDRSGAEPDRVPQICAWYEAAGFEVEWVSPETEHFGVAVCRYKGEQLPLPAGRLFEFTA